MIYIIMGVSGAGKSTIAKYMAEELECNYVDADDFHSISNKNKMARGESLNDDERFPWLKQLANKIKEWNEERTEVFLACSALKESYRRILIGDNSNIKFIYLKIDKELCKQRLRGRKGHFFNESLIDSQFDILEEPKNDCIHIFSSLSIEEIKLKILKIYQEKSFEK